MFLEQKPTALLLHIKVIPNSSRTQLAGPLGNSLKIKIAQPPEDGRANRAVIELLAQTLHLPPTQIRLLAGHTSPHKTLQLTGITLAQAQQLLLPKST